MLTTADFLQYAQWVGILTLVCGAFTLLAFILNWGFRFRFVGVTGFMGVLTGGLFALSLGPLTHSAIVGSVHYTLIYDTGATQVVIRVPPNISESALDATLRQAASNLFSYGRLGGTRGELTVRARTVIHPEPGVSQPLFLGQVKRSLASRTDDKMVVELFQENIAQLPKPTA